MRARGDWGATNVVLVSVLASPGFVRLLLDSAGAMCFDMTIDNP
jgi:hypothetical protein